MLQETPPTPPAKTDRKPIFDLLRRLIGRRFRQAEVDSIDDALDTALGETVAASNRSPDHDRDDATTRRTAHRPSVPTCRRSRRIGEDGIALIKRFEGCARKRSDGMIEAYPDPGTGAEPWTIGWGATGIDDQTGGGHIARIGPRTVWTQEQCDARFARDLKSYARAVDRAIGDAPTSRSQFDALVSFHYNTGAIARATLTRKHVAGDYEGALAEFARWNRAGGRALKGLTRRRAAEARLYSNSSPTE